jgi:MFS family permease
MVIAIVATSIMVASSFYGKLARRFAPYLLIAFVFGSYGVGHLLAGAVDSLPLTLFSMAFFGLASAFVQPVAANYIFTNLPPATHARAMSSLLGCLFLVQFINPFVIKPLNSLVGLAPGFIWIGAINVAAACVTLAAPLYLRRSAVKV